MQPSHTPRDSCWAPPGALAWTSINLLVRNGSPWKKMPWHTVFRCDGHAVMDREPSVKDSQAAPLCSSIPLPPPPPSVADQPLSEPLHRLSVQSSLSISRFFDSLTNPSNKVARQSHRHPAPTFQALSRTRLFKCPHSRSEPANYPLSPKY